MNKSIYVLVLLDLILERVTFWSLSHFIPNSSEGRPFRLGSGANMEKVLRMDRNMHTVSRVDIL